MSYLNTFLAARATKNGLVLSRQERLRLSSSGEGDGHWVTIHGSAVFIGKEGNIKKGPKGMIGKSVKELEKKRDAAVAKADKATAIATGESDPNGHHKLIAQPHGDADKKAIAAKAIAQHHRDASILHKKAIEAGGDRSNHNEMIRYHNKNAESYDKVAEQHRGEKALAAKHSEVAKQATARANKLNTFSTHESAATKHINAAVSHKIAGDKKAESYHRAMYEKHTKRADKLAGISGKAHVHDASGYD